MSAAQKRKTADTKRKRQTSVTSVLKQFHCDMVSYEFDTPLSEFKSKSFFGTTGIKPSTSWSAVINPENLDTGYHVYFKGYLEKRTMNATIEFWNGGHPLPRDIEPFSESIMQWFGQFFKVPCSRAFATARFSKPQESWRSRFNLPFKVTMAGAEVVINGVSLVLPKNPYRAVSAFVDVNDGPLSASIYSIRSVEFSKFDIREEIAAFNEAGKIFMEQLT